ncbi:MAG: YfcE family phosphodiesterase [Planctomycetaceae bacterium]
MRIGVFADAHDHKDNVVRAVAEFNRRECELVLFAGDLVSPMTVPPLRRLKCPLVACFGDNDGNKTGIEGGMRIVGSIREPPFVVTANDGTAILLTHSLDAAARELVDECRAVVTGHTHRPKIAYDAEGRLRLNPGETSGWSFRKPTIAILETGPLQADIVPLPEMPPPPEYETV